MLCGTCYDAQIEEQESRCYLCNKLTKQHRVCRGCRSKSGLRRVWWVSEYTTLTKQLITDMKFHRKRAYGREFAKLLVETLPYLPEHTHVVPVPTASTRVRRRGFDQAVVIAKQIAKDRGLPYTPLLRRLDQTDQIGKSKKQRYQQMQNSLSFHGSLPPNATVLLVDDVLTTGATLEVAAKLLRQHGAVHVDAVVIARTLFK
jgi:ComF family protein